MAIVQISQITNRLGLNIDLPQLAGGELGWSTDTRQLYIGNGTLAEGAPVVGNTELLTEFSDILNVAAAYTYKGTAAGYTVQTGPTPGTPVVQSLQNWMDQYASVKDFGATGDGVTDDTAAINRALFQLYCRGTNAQVRRALFFPAGVYKVSSTINIPTYATLIGDGVNASIIQMISNPPAVDPVTGKPITHVAQTADSLQNTIPDIGATPPQSISVNNITFESLDPSKSIFLVQQATECEFRGVIFRGVGTTITLVTDTLSTACVNFGSTPSLVTTNILFDDCKFTGTVYGIYTLQQTKGVVVTNSNFNILYQGVMLAVGSSSYGGPTGTRVTNNIFDNIFREGIVFGSGASNEATGLNASGYNIFYDVGNDFGGITNPQSSIILLTSTSVSIGDMFARSSAYATTYPQIDTGDSVSATLNTTGLRIGSKTVQSGLVATLADGQTGGIAFTVDVGPGVNAGQVTSFKVDYNLVQGTKYRTGTCMVAAAGGGIVTFTDDYNENATMNVYLYAQQAGDIVSFSYNTTPENSPTPIPSTFYYSVSYLN